MVSFLQLSKVRKINIDMEILVELASNFIVRSCSPEAVFVKGRMIWCNWDIDELKAKIEIIEKDPMLMTTGVYGWPFQA